MIYQARGWFDYSRRHRLKRALKHACIYKQSWLGLTLYLLARFSHLTIIAAVDVRLDKQELPDMESDSLMFASQVEVPMTADVV